MTSSTLQIDEFDGHVRDEFKGDQRIRGNTFYGSFYKDKRRRGSEKYLKNNPQDLVIDFRIRVKNRKVSRSLGNWMAFRTTH